MTAGGKSGSRSFDITDMSGSDDDVGDHDHASNWIGPLTIRVLSNFLSQRLITLTGIRHRFWNVENEFSFWNLESNLLSEHGDP